MTSKDIHKLYHKIGIRNNLRDSEIKDIIEAPYKFTKQNIDKLELLEIKSEEEFKELKTNFGYKYLGKIYTTYRSIINLKNNKNGSNKCNRKGSKEDS